MTTLRVAIQIGLRLFEAKPQAFRTVGRQAAGRASITSFEFEFLPAPAGLQVLAIPVTSEISALLAKSFVADVVFAFVSVSPIKNL
jgi:hypothetical protein